MLWLRPAAARGKRPDIGAILLSFLLFAAWSVVSQPRWLLTLIAKLSPDVTYYIETDESAVALTIDDGPDPATTPRLLGQIEKYRAHATFFLISDRLRGNEELVRRIVAEGHELGNHLTTDEPSIILKKTEFERRLLEAHKALSRFTKVSWFRPGSGWYSDKMLSILHRHGYRCALGSVYPFDPQIPSSWFAAHHVLRRVRAGSVIVLHDHGSRGERTIEALAAILPELKRRGLNVVTLSDLAGMPGSRTPR